MPWKEHLGSVNCYFNKGLAIHPGWQAIWPKDFCFLYKQTTVYLNMYNNNITANISEVQLPTLNVYMYFSKITRYQINSRPGKLLSFVLCWSSAYSKSNRCPVLIFQQKTKQSASCKSNLAFSLKWLPSLCGNCSSNQE